MIYTGEIRKESGTVVFMRSIYRDDRTKGKGKVRKIGVKEMTPKDFFNEIYECLGKTKIEVEIVPI